VLKARVLSEALAHEKGFLVWHDDIQNNDGRRIILCSQKSFKTLADPGHNKSGGL
jgi:hypothetical protein